MAEGIGLDSVPGWLKDAWAKVGLGGPSFMERAVAFDKRQQERIARGEGPLSPDSPDFAEAVDLAGTLGPNDLAAMGGIGLGGIIRAYHGSPHTFDAFDLSRIGTGEGAQAYGHGLYFAENPGVAKDYERRLGGPPSVKVNDNLARETILSRIVAAKAEIEPNLKQVPEWTDPDTGEVFYSYSADAPKELIARNDALADLEAEIRKVPDDVGVSNWLRYRVAARGDNALKNLQEKTGVQLDDLAKEGSAFYTVDLDVDPDDLLDWDAPLSQQSEKVRKALEGFTEPVAMADDSSVRAVLMEMPALVRVKFMNGLKQGKTVDEVMAGISGQGTPEFQQAMQDAADKLRGARISVAQQKTTEFRPDMTGANLHGQIREKYGSMEAAAQALRAAGIPGIRYYDAGSRTSGEGTRNFVLFDDALAKIVERK